MERVRVRETAVAEVRGEAVGAANGGVDEFVLPDGTTQSGPTMLLCLLEDDEDVRVGLGSEVEIAEVIWRVVSVSLQEDGQGWVDLEAPLIEEGQPAPRQALDFIFKSRCCRCGWETGWDGETGELDGRLAVHLRCTGCADKGLMGGGRFEKAFFDEPPIFTPGRDA